jgi:hypothetical protein
MLFTRSAWEGGISISNSCNISSMPSHKRAPCLISMWVPRADGWSTRPGTANTVRPCSSASVAVITAPLLTPASTTIRPMLRAGYDPVPIGKRRAIRLPAHGVFADHRPMLRDAHPPVRRFLPDTIYPARCPARPGCARSPFNAARWAAVSMPRASPLTTVNPVRAS